MKYGDIVEKALQPLREMGLRAEQDPSRIGKFPAVIAYPVEVRIPNISSSGTEIDLEMYLITGDKPAKHALNDLGEMLETVREVFAVSKAVPDAVQLRNHSADALPALRITTTFTYIPD